MVARVEFGHFENKSVTFRIVEFDGCKIRNLFKGLDDYLLHFLLGIGHDFPGCVGNIDFLCLIVVISVYKYWWHKISLRKMKTKFPRLSGQCRLPAKENAFELCRKLNSF